MRVRRVVLVKGGYRRVREALERFREAIYHYNSLLRGTGYYLKPVHIVTRVVGGERRRYVYHGRYWYRLERRDGRLVWRYVGRFKPRELEEAGVPDPPRDPLEGLRYARIEGTDDIIMDFEVFERFRWLFEGLEAVVLEVISGRGVVATGDEEPSPRRLSV